MTIKKKDGECRLLEEIEEMVSLLLKGKIPEPLEMERCQDEPERSLAESFNRLVESFAEIRDFIIPLSQGELGKSVPSSKNLLASPFKELRSRLIQITWQAKEIAQGDYSQRIDFMGDFSEAFNSMVVKLDEKDRALKEKIEELEEALSNIKTLKGLIPICAYCKQVRDDQGYWSKVETYLSKHSEAEFSHGICKPCGDKLLEEAKAFRETE